MRREKSFPCCRKSNGPFDFAAEVLLCRSALYRRRVRTKASLPKLFNPVQAAGGTTAAEAWLLKPALRHLLQLRGRDAVELLHGLGVEIDR